MGHSFTILVAEQDRSISALMEEILLGEGYTVRRSLHVPPTIREIEQANPAGIIIDIDRNDADACILLLERMRQTPALHNVGLLVSSTDGRLLTELKAPIEHMRGATLVKPFDLYEFIEKITYSLTVAAATPGQAQPYAPPKTYNLN